MTFYDWAINVLAALLVVLCAFPLLAWKGERLSFLSCLEPDVLAPARKWLQI
jgi:hypothetical protein